jgi:hypothetical protein
MERYNKVIWITKLHLYNQTFHWFSLGLLSKLFWLWFVFAEQVRLNVGDLKLSFLDNNSAGFLNNKFSGLA